jgi:prepilin-type N-terminal cleavage/methylation domain-containing protein
MTHTPLHHPRSTGPKRQPTRSRHGFSLIEIMVVVSILAILMIISVAAFMNRQGPVSATRITLAALKGAATEYEVQTGAPPHSGRNDPYNGPVAQNYVGKTFVDASGSPGNAVIGGSTSGADDVKNFSIERFVHQLLINPVGQKMVASLGKDALVDSDGNRFADVVDGWGVKVIYYNPADDFNATHSSPQNYPKAAFLPPSRTPYFASAGPDGKWGDYRQLVRKQKGDSLTTAQATLAKEAEDNIYSFDLVKK